MKKLLTIAFVLLSLAFINQAIAQTPPPVIAPPSVIPPPTPPSAIGSAPSAPTTPSLYILGASSANYLPTYAGFGVNMTPDTCLGYTAIKSDISKITNVLTVQIEQTIRNYNTSVCNTQATPDANCIKHLDTLNNLALTYATYQIEGLRQSKDRAYICDANNNRIAGRYKSTYYGIDFPAIAYASVRDAYAGYKYTDYVTFINNINKNVVYKLNGALTSTTKTFVDVVPTSAIKTTTYTAPTPATTTSGVRAPRQRVVPAPVQYSLRTLAQKTFQTTSAVKMARQRVVASASNTTLSGPNMFLFFGLTNNINDRTIGAIPLNSLGEYVALYNANPVRFGEIYSATNKGLISNGSIILNYVNSLLTKNIKAADMGGKPITSTSPSDQPALQNQKAFVGGAIGNLLDSLKLFFKNILGAKEVGAATSLMDSGSGDSGVGTMCPAMPNPRPAPLLTEIKDKNNRDIAFSNSIAYAGFVFAFNHLYVLNSSLKEVVHETVAHVHENNYIPSSDEYNYLINRLYSSDNYPTYNSVANSDPTMKPRRSKSQVDDLLSGFSLVDIKFTNKVRLTSPDKPYSCLRGFGDGFQLQHLTVFKVRSIFVNVTALNQSANGVFTTELMRKEVMSQNYADAEKAACNIDLIRTTRQ